MKFGPVAPLNAVGATLAHSQLLPGGRLKKGHIVTQAAADAMVAAGIEQVFAAHLGPDDVCEDDAAQCVAQVLAGEGTSISCAEPATGRVNLHAASTGLFRASREKIDDANGTDPAVTIATLADGSWVEKGRMVATVKIIPFAVSNKSLAEIERKLLGTHAVEVRPASAKRVGLVATQLPFLKPSVMDKTVRVLGDRLRLSESELAGEQRVPHTAAGVAEGLRSFSERCDLMIVFGASAIVDVDDIVPAGIRLAGGSIDYFGMPVDPGNLLLIGELAGTPVVGAPGCARSPAENGFDWVLQRLVCGLPVTRKYLAELGVGGLLMEITSRPQPRESKP